MEVAEFAFNDHDALSADTLIELVQISGNSRSPLSDREEARQKLLGLQLAHFGAFYKRSWRANDWTFGRLDGSERLVNILLNPERLQRFHTAASAAAAIRRIAVDSVESDVLQARLDAEWITRRLADRTAKELAFLDAANQDLPSALPACAEAITLRLHYGILREELVVLGESVRLDEMLGADSRSHGPALVENLRNPQGQTAAPFSPEQAAHRLGEGLIAKESFAHEVGSDLFTRTLAHAMATTQGTLASKAAHLGPVSLFFASLRWPLLGFHYVAQGLTRQSRTAAALHGGLLVLGLTLVLLQFMWTKDGASSLPTGLASFGWAVLAIGLFLSVVRTPSVVGAALIAVAVVGLFMAPAAFKLLALMFLLLGASVLLPPLQVVFGFSLIAVAALYSSGWKPATWQVVAWAHPAIQFGGVVMAAFLVATLQASGALARADHALRIVMRRLFAGGLRR